ncbi:hypothetical protein [Bythopirellula polymerisocia]|nr:hypothetical protein [Bythopirellula polymerisocia]
MLSCIAISSAHATLYTGSGESGFAGAVGASKMNWTDDGTTVTVNFTKGTSGNFSDSFVLYFDTGVSGRNAIGTLVNDRQDTNRSAISFMEASTGKILTLPAGFQASYAISINTGFGGLWSIPDTGSIGNNGLGFVAGVGNPSSASEASFNFSFNLSDIGLTPNSGAEIKFVGTYLNPFGGDGSLGFASNEGYGSGFTGANIGQNDFTFSGSPLSYIASVPEPSAFLFGGLVCSVLGANYIRKWMQQKSA